MNVQDSTCHATSSTNSSQTLQASGAGAQVEDGRGNWCGVACSKLKEMKIVGKGIRPYICIYIYIYIYMVPPPPRPILSQNLLVFALFCCFLLCLNVCFFWRLFYMFKKLCRVVKTLPPLIKLFSFNRKGFLQNLEKTKKPKNQNFLEKFWFQVKRWFFLVFLEFFWFFLV